MNITIDKPTILLMFSGGLDSLGCLYLLLTDKEIVSNLPFSFDCLKLQLFHFLALKNPNVPVKLVYDLFYLLFKKQDLKDKVDWNNIDTIDNYKNSDLIYSLPTEQQILKYFPGAKRKNSYGYSMSECCPFYIF